MLTMDETEGQPETVAPTDGSTGEDSTALEFTLKPVTEKPKRKYRKGSKYDVVIEAFLKARNKMVAVSIGDKDANYMRTQLNKRIEAQKLTKKIQVSVVNNVLYLEKK